MDARSRTAFPVPSAQDGATQPTDISQVHTTLLRRPAIASPEGPATASSTTERSAERHTAEARLWREQAERLVDELKQDMNRFARAVERWHRLMSLSMRTTVEDAELAAIERELPLQAQRMGRCRERWTACLVAAREHDDTAERLRAMPVR
jgi:hypothetical protein